MKADDYTADHLEYLVNNGWTMNTDVLTYHMFTRPGAYIVIELTGEMLVFEWNNLNRSYDCMHQYSDTRQLSLPRFAMLCQVMNVADVAGNLVNVFVKS